MSLFKKKKDPETVLRVVTIKRDPTELIAQEWRCTQDLVAKARDALNNQDVMLMVDVMRNSNPNRATTIPADTEYRAHFASFAAGWNAAVECFKSLGEPINTESAPVATFEPEED